MGLHLRKIEVRPEPASHQFLGVVEEVETEVEQTTGDRLSVDGEVLLIQVPATGTSDQSWEGAVGAQLVFLVALFEVDLATDGIIQVDLTVDHVFPGRGARVCIHRQHVSQSGVPANDIPSKSAM